MAEYPPPLNCVVHCYSEDSKLNAYELPTPHSVNALLFTGGLFDGPHTVGYVRTISEYFNANGIPWSIFEIRMSSSFTGFAHGSLSRDTEEMTRLVKYLRHLGKQKIVLMGHSTGSQDSIHYSLNEDSKVPIDGCILQAPVSDREAFTMDTPSESLLGSVKLAKEMIDQGKGEEMLPRWKGDLSGFPPTTAYRWYSLIGVGGDDDYFSTDLSDERLKATFGQLSKPTLILHSANDQHVSAKVDKVALVKKWSSFSTNGAISPLSGVIPGANHEVLQSEARLWLAQTVAKFLQDI